MNLCEYKELLERFCALFPTSCIAVNRKLNDSFIDNPPVQEDGELLINYLADDTTNGGDGEPEVVYEFLPICGCGDPKTIVLLYLDVLEWANEDYVKRTTNPISGQPLLSLTMLYVLSDLNFSLLEHGTSVYGSTLTEKGKVALECLREWKKRHVKDTKQQEGK